MQVLNKKHCTTQEAESGVYIGRPSKFGNPYTIGLDGSRAQVIRKFETFLKSNPELMSAVKRELRGKTLVCWCAPQACHGDLLMKYANQ